MNLLTRPRIFHLVLLWSLLISALGIRSQPVHAAGMISHAFGVTYAQDFDTLVNSGTSSVLPNGWYLSESSANANTTYSAGSGTSTTGDTYSYGATGNTERAFGELRSANLVPTLGANFSNDSGATITSLVITYAGEQWRLGAVGRADRLDFQYSTDATSLSTGTWMDVDALDFTAPVTSGTVGALNGNLSANRTVVRYTITGLNIPNGTGFWIRWNDLDATGSDDGLAVDDFSLSAGFVSDTTTADFSAGSVGDCLVDVGVGDGALKLNLPSSSCVFISRVFDSGMLVDWTTLVPTTILPAGTSIAIDARTGNTPSPDISWTSWQVASGTLTNPGSQYIQYRATLEATDTGQTPVLEDVTINYVSGSLSKLKSPAGSLVSWDGSFSWTGVDGATWYLVEVYTPGISQLYRKWYTSEQTNCLAGVDCSLAPADLSLPTGDYLWRVLDYGAYGYGIWTYFNDFSLNGACYTLVTDVTPADSGSVYVVPEQSCTGGYLAGTVVQLTATPGTGYVFSSWSGDAGGMSNPVSVTMDANKSVTAEMFGNTPLTPSGGPLSTWNGSFTWTGARSDATWYLLEVQRSVDSVQVFRKWYTSTQTNCAGGTACSVMPSDLNLDNGEYKWRVLDYGANGYGINSAFKTFNLSSACYTLTWDVIPEDSGEVTTPAQSCPGGYIAGTVIQLKAVPYTGYAFSSWSGDAGGTGNPVSITMDADRNVTANMSGNSPLTPTGTQTSWDNTFTWTGARSDATWYLLEVQTSSGAQVFRKWYTSAQTNCAGGTACSAIPSETAYLANGDYQWRVMDYGAYGYGVNSAFKAFKMDVTVACTNIRYVDADSTAVTPDGCGWGTAYQDLQAALDDTGAFDQIWVAEGTYKPTQLLDLLDARSAFFGLKSGLAIYGGFQGTEAELSARDEDPLTNGTVLSGDIGTVGVISDNAYQVVRGDNLLATAVLDGFTITGGNSNGSSGHGGGIYLAASSPTFANLLITDNRAASNGGGVYMITSGVTVEADYSNPSLTDVIISGNIAARGGGLFTQNASPILTRVTFVGNLANGGAGGGMNNQTLNTSDEPSAPSLTDVVFENNTSNGGGGMFNTNSVAALNRVTFNGNTAKRRGGGMLNENNGNPTLTNVTFYDNVSEESLGGAPWGGGGMMNVTSSPVLNNVTFSSNNSANIGGDGIYNATGSYPVITNSILWGDLDDEIVDDGSTTTISYSVVQGGFTGTNILTTDPNLQALANNGGFTQTMALGAGSSAVDQGSGCAASDQRGVTRPQGLVCDIGAYELDKVLLIAPSGTLGSWNNTFSWTGQSDATWYLLEVYTPDGATQVFRKWYTSPQTNCSGGVACSVSPAETAALSGTYKWRILEYGSFGYGVWTPYMNFSVP